MKTKALNQIDTNLEQIIMKLAESGQIGAEPGQPGSLNPLEFESLKLAQETLSLLRTSRSPCERCTRGK